MPILTSGSTTTVTLGAYDSITLQNRSGQASISVGGTVVNGNHSGSRTYGPYPSGGSVSLNAISGDLYYEVADGAGDTKRVFARGSALLAEDGSTVSAGGAATGVGLVAGRSRCPSVIHTEAAYQSGMGQIRQIAKDDITEIMIATATWANADGNSEKGFGSAAQFACAIHDLSGNITQMVWGGAPVVTQADKTNAFSDWVTLTKPIKRGQTYFVKTWGKSVSGAGFGFSRQRNLGGTWLDRCVVGSVASPAPDQTMSAGLGSLGGNGFTYMVEPVAIYGKTSRGSVVLIGTSITQGQTDSASDGYALVGRTERQLGRYWGCVNFGGGGASAVNEVTAGKWTLRKELIDKITVPVAIVSEFGTNDIANSRPVANLLADLNTIRGILGREFFIQGDCLPRTDASNAVVANFATVRPDFNTALIALPTGIDGYFVDSQLVESTATPGTWANPPGSGTPDTGDGVHPGANAGKKFQDAENAAKAVRAVLGSA